MISDAELEEEGLVTAVVELETWPSARDGCCLDADRGWCGKNGEG
jgi:hypothetical protein